MIVVGDTSTVSNLIQIGQLELLNKLYGGVTIPPKVRDELYRVAGNRAAVQDATWIEFAVPSDIHYISSLANRLDPGESEAIALALELDADYLVIDEYAGRAEAMKLGIPIVGLLGVLIAAKKANHIAAVRPHIDRVTQHGFRLSSDLVQRVLRKLGEE